MNKTTFTRAKRGFTLSLKEYSLSTKKGFTLIELLVVVAIIGVLATVVLGSISSARAKARDARRVSDIKTIQTALEMYHLDNDSYPVVGWAGSHTNSWENLETVIGVTLPVDPLNISTGSKSSDANIGDFVYSYFASSQLFYCSGQAYMIAFNLQGKNGDGANYGVTLCDNTIRTYGNVFVVGVNSNNSTTSIDLSGTSK